MIRRLILPLLLVCSTANAQFTPGQILTAAQLNAALAGKTSNSAAAITGGSIANATITGGTISGLTSPLPVASGGTGSTTSTGSGSVVLSASPTLASPTITGSFTAPGLVTPSSLASQAANTVLANITGSTASPTAFVLPSCSTSTSALQYTSGTGFTCYANSATTTGTLAQFAATTSAQLASVLSDETGSGAAVFGTSPTISSPTITGGTITNAPVSGSTGSFTTLSASSTVSGTGFSSYLASPPAIGGTAAASGAFTTLSASGTVSGAGFNTYLASPPAIGATTPAAGSFTTLSTSSGLAGITSGTNGATGKVGECISSASSTIGLTTGVATNLTSISLTAGDWLLMGQVSFQSTASTTVAYILGSTGPTSATVSGTSFLLPGANGSVVTTLGAAVPTQRVNITSTTTYYLVSQASFGGSTLSSYGAITGCRWH